MGLKTRVFGQELSLGTVAFQLVFHGIHVGIFVAGWYAQAANEHLAGLNTLTFSVWLSRGAGLCLTVDTTLILLPMCRNIMTWIRPKLRWLPLDETQYFHRHVAYAMLFWTIVHTTAHYVNFFNVERNLVRPEAALQIHYSQAGGITGHIMLLCMFLIYTTSHAKIRQQSFETFWYTHHLFIPFLLGMYTHATGCFVRDSTNPYSPFAGEPFWDHCLGYEGWRWELIAGGLYLIERLYRVFNSKRPTTITKVIKHPYDAMEIQFVKPSMRYKAGQWLFINCPSVAKHQWHPFTITSCPFDGYVSIHVRQVGDFTRALADACGAGSSQNELYGDLDPMGMYEITPAMGEQMPQIYIDGPYGAPAEDVFDNEVAVLIGTGIGVTPWASILKNIWHLRSSPNPPQRLRRVEFIWVARDTTSFKWFQELLSCLEEQAMTEAEAVGRPRSEFLRIHTFLTQKLDIDAANNIILNSMETDINTKKDPLTELSTRTNFGRPDFKKLFPAMRDGIMNASYMGEFDHDGRTDVGVYFCGPNAGARQVKQACKAATNKYVNFKFWKEHF